MGNRIADNIRRIVWNTIVNEWGGKEGKLSDLIKDKDALPGRRGIGYQSNIDNETGGEGITGDTAAPDNSNIYDPLGTTTPDPTGGSSSSGSGYASAADIIDNATNLGNALSNALKGMDGATDPDTGDNLKFNFDDKYDPIPENYDTDGTYTPRWDDPEDPPELDNWVLGTLWKVNNASVISNPSYWSTVPQNGAALTVNYLNAFAVGGVTDWTFVGWAEQGATSWLGNYESAGSSNAATVGIVSANCTPPSTACPLTAPKPTQWPSDTDISIKFEDGQFKSSVYDPEQPLKMVNPSSKVEYNFGSGRTGAAEVTKDLGYMVYETTSIGGSATGTVMRYNSKGVFQNSFPAAEIGNYQPK